MGIDYVDGEDVTNNEHLAEAINMTREGMAPVGGQYDEVINPNDSVVQTKRDSCVFVAVESLEKIDSAPEGSQEKIDEVLDKLRSVQHASAERQASVMAEAHDTLQDIWVPPTE